VSEDEQLSDASIRDKIHRRMIDVIELVHQLDHSGEDTVTITVDRNTAKELLSNLIATAIMKPQQDREVKVAIGSAIGIKEWE
jgi:hypothetical protein